MSAAVPPPEGPDPVASQPGAPGPSRPRPAPAPRAPGRGRRGPAVSGALLLAVVILAAAGLGWALARAGSPGTAAGPFGRPAAVAAARAFLARYELPDGRVIRTDQGGDSVSEGQAYAMLLAVAAGDRARFDAAWHWATAHLGQPGGLWAWHWQGGRVVGSEPASDADVEAAWALTLAGARFGDAGYARAAAATAAAVLSQETAMTARGAVLVAGPWARGDVTVDPSYLVPEAAAALRATSAGGGWASLTGDDRGVLQALVRSGGSGASLPPDWARVGPGPAVTPEAGSTDRAGQPTYGFDAERVPVVLAASCDPSDRASAGSLWEVLSKAPDAGADAGYSLDGAQAGGPPSPLGLVAAAAAAGAAGHEGTARGLLGRATAMSGAHHTYYGDAWVALGEVMLTTRLLGTCPVA